MMERMVGKKKKEKRWQAKETKKSHDLFYRIVQIYLYDKYYGQGEFTNLKI